MIRVGRFYFFLMQSSGFKSCLSLKSTQFMCVYCITLRLGQIRFTPVSEIKTLCYVLVTIPPLLLLHICFGVFVCVSCHEAYSAPFACNQLCFCLVLKIANITGAAQILQYIENSGFVSKTQWHSKCCKHLERIICDMQCKHIVWYAM